MISMSAAIRKPVVDPAAWRGEQIAHRDDWIITLGAPLLAELDTALDRIEAQGIDALDIRREDFPLPGFSAVRDSIRELTIVAHEDQALGVGVQSSDRPDPHVAVDQLDDGRPTLGIVCSRDDAERLVDEKGS